MVLKRGALIYKLKIVGNVAPYKDSFSEGECSVLIGGNCVARPNTDPERSEESGVGALSWLKF